MAEYHLTTLSLHQNKRKELLSLIEHSFSYPPEHHFEIDFYPLMKKENAHNNWILLDEENNLVGHIGVLPRFLTHKNLSFKVSLLGGIAVLESHRGEGLLRKMMTEVLSNYQSDSALFILWSDKHDLYKKFGFELFGGQEIYSLRGKGTLTPTTLSVLLPEERKRIFDLYKNEVEKKYLCIGRDQDYFDDLAAITTSKLYLEKKDDLITSYAFAEKGHDLKEVVHELVVTQTEYQEFLAKLPHKTLWQPEYPKLTKLKKESLSFMGTAKIANQSLFQDMIHDLTANKIQIDTLLPDQILFAFNGENYSLTYADFLTGLFGPNPIKEFEGLIPPIFISGLDSI